MNIRVAIFEDNYLHREALRSLIASAPGMICTGAFANAAQVEADVEFSHADVILMDIEMPGRTGIEATKIIHDKYPEVKVLIQTVFDDNDKIFNALCAGASGYLLKSDQPAKQLDAIRDVYNSGGPMSASIAKKVMQFFTSQNVILVTPEKEVYNLSIREKEILSLMMVEQNYRNIAEKAFISYETVRTHVKNIYKKLHVVCRSEAILKARQQGMI